MSVKAVLCRIMSWYLCLRHGVITVARVAFAARASVIMSVLASIIIWFPDQIAEVLRMMADQTNPSGGWNISVFVLASIFVAISCWYWARTTLYLQIPGAEAGGDFKGWVVRQMPRLFGTLPLLATSLALYQAGDFPPTVEAAAALKGRLQFLALACLVLAVLFYVLLFLRRRLFRLESSAKSEGMPTPWDLGRASQIVLIILTIIGGASFVAFTFFPIESSWPLNAAALVHFWAGTMVPIVAILTYLGSRLKVPFLSLLVVAAVVFSYFDLNDNHVVVSAEGAAPPAPPKASAAMAQWLDGRADKDRYASYPVFFVAAEGGGIRAAYFTAFILATLQDHCPRFAQHTFAISGVSGGSLGAAVFAGLAADQVAGAPEPSCALVRPADMPTQESARTILEADLLTPLVGAFLYRDLVQRFLPFPIRSFDRARALEDAFAAAWRGARESDRFARSFYDLWGEFPGAAPPALLLNSTAVATGAPMIVSNLELEPGPLRQFETLASIDPALAPSLAAAAGLSARFPLLTPAGSILTPKAADQRPKRRFVDGGYFDNSGLISLMNLVGSPPLVEAYRARRIKVVIIRIENGAATTRLMESTANGMPTADGKEAEALPRYAGYSFGEVLSPIRAMLNTRGAHGSLSKLQSFVFRDSLVQRGVDAEVITFTLKPGLVPVPLGWALSAGARRDMEDQLGKPDDCAPSGDPENACALSRIIRLLQPAS